MKRFTRSHTDRKIAGVCGGLGEYFEIDPTVVRLALVFAGALTAFVPFLIAYVVAWILVPDSPSPRVRVETDPPPRGESAEAS